MSTRVRRRTLQAGSAAVFLVAVAVTLINIDTTYNVQAVTETLSFSTGSLPTPRWALEGFTLSDGYDVDGESFTGSLELGPEIAVSVERVSLGPLQILCRAPRSDGQVGTLYDPNERQTKTVGSRLVLVATDIEPRAATGRTIVLPFAGRVEIGQQVGYGALTGHAILREGRVSLLGRSLLTSTHYDAGSVGLDAGDHFSVETPKSPAFGFVVADERPALSVIYRVVGKGGFVTRFGAQGYEIGASVRARIVNDRVIQGTWLTFTFLTSVAILRRLFERNGGR